jgi:uracil-DNA glycosylase
MSRLNRLVSEIAACRVCALPHEPRPVVWVHPEARILIAGQAPGRRVHESGVPWDDPSGDRLREWLQMDRAQFYDFVTPAQSTAPIYRRAGSVLRYGARVFCRCYKKFN